MTQPHQRLARLCILFGALLAAAIFYMSYTAMHRANSTKTQTAIDSRQGANATAGPRAPRLMQSLAQMPLTFEENRGQFDSRVTFLSRGAGYGLYLSPGQATIVHQGKVHVTDGGDASSPIAALANSDVVTKSVTQLTWLGANPNAQPHGAGRQAGESNYLIGKDPRKWQRHVQHYDRVRLAGLYPGIDLVYHGVQQQVELDYVIAPHADPKTIQIGISGPSLVSVDASGQLSISSAGDEMLLLPPVAYQEKDGRREIVQARYVLADSHRLGFELGAYDRSRPLVIDPVLTFAATIGSGIGFSMMADVAVDSAQNIYLTGTSCDTNYPTTTGAFQTSGGNNFSQACNNVIVTKLNPTASTLLYSTYIGGQTSVNFGSRLLVNGTGEATIVGTTTASDFPTTSGAYQTSLKNGTCNYSVNLMGKPCSDAFLLKLSADGSSLVYSTLFGGERVDIAMGLAQDVSGNTYITGLTNSTLLPVNSSSLSSTYGGGVTCQNGQVPCFDAFIAKISPNGSQLLASTYLGGNDDDFAGGVALDASGNVYVTGSADSTNFPTTPGAYQTTHAGTIDNRDAYLAKFDSNLHTLQYSTLFGGSADDVSVNLRVDSSGVAYITGSTISSDLPTTAGAYQITYKGPAAATTTCGNNLDSAIESQPTCGDIFVAKIDPSKTGAAQLVFSTFLGGNGNDFAFDLALDSQNNVWLVGDTNSSDFPLTSDAYFTNPSTAGLFLSEIKNDGSQLLFSTFLSQVQTSDTLGLGITIDPSQNVYVTGKGAVSVTPGAYATGSNMFLMKFVPGTARPGVHLSATSINFPRMTTPVGTTSAPKSVTLTNSGATTLHLAVSIQPGFAGAPVPFSEYDNCGGSVAAGATCTISAIYQPLDPTGNIESGTIQIASDAPGSPQTISLQSSSGTLDSASFVPPTLTFNGQAPGTTSVAQTTGLNTPASSSQSLGAVVKGAPTVTGPNASEFAVNTSNCPIGPLGCFLSVTFTPAANATGTRTAILSVPSNAANSPQTVSLVGTVSSGPFAAFPFSAGITPTAVGQTFNTTINVKNTGGSTLTITNVAVTGQNSADFVASVGNCGSVTTQQSCSLNLSFKPSAPGTKTATLTLADNEITPATLTLTAYGSSAGGPILSYFTTPSSVNNLSLFPDTVVGRAANLHQVLVSVQNLASPGPNSGAHITSATLTGDFTQTNNCPSPTTVFASGAGCIYTVVFAPTAQGLRTGTLSIVSDAPGGQTLTVNFAGNGVQVPVATSTPPNMNFGSQAVGTTSTAQTATVTNSGMGTLNLSNVVLTGPFTKTTTCAATLAANTSCTYTIKFAPSAAGPASGTLTASTNAAGGLLAIGLNGAGVTGPVAKAQPASLTFGNQAINSTSAPQAVTFSNAGDTAFTIAGIRASENFSETNNCSSSLGPGASCTINVSFAPTTDVLIGGNAPTNGSIFVTTSAPGSPFAIPALGHATPSAGAATNLTITSSLNPSTVGQLVTFTATVASTGTGTPTGTVTFFDSSNQLGAPVNLSAGKATLATSTLAQGNRSIFFRYSGDATFAPATSSGISQTVNAGSSKAATTTTTVSSLNPSTVGQNVTFTATVASGTAGAITGTVTFFDGSTQIGSPGTLTGGSASISTSTLSQGSHSVTAQYSGDAKYASSTSTAVTQTVNAVSKATTATSLASSQSSSSPGVNVTFTATVTSGTAGTISGTVNFLDGTTSLGTGTLSAGKATFSTSTLVPGSHSITASYGGDTTFALSTSSALTQIVLKASATALASSINPSVGGQAVTFTATVTSGTAGTITGTVTFFDGSTQIGSAATLNGSSASVTTSTLKSTASHSVTAQYSGDTNFAASTSPALSQTVGLAAIAPVSNVPPVVAGQSVVIPLTLYAASGSNLTFTMSCVGAPVKSSCVFSPNPVTPLPPPTGTPVQLTFSTASSRLPPAPSNQGPWPWGTLEFSAALAALLAAGMSLSRHAPKRRLAFGMCFAVVCLAAVLAGCGSNSYNAPPYTGTPKGTATFTVVGTSTTGTPPTTVSTQVSVTVQ